MGERVFTRFEMCFGRIFHVTQGPSLAGVYGTTFGLNINSIAKRHTKHPFRASSGFEILYEVEQYHCRAQFSKRLMTET